MKYQKQWTVKQNQLYSSNHSNREQLLDAISFPFQLKSMSKIIFKLEQYHTVNVLENRHSRCCLVIMCVPMYSMNKTTARVIRQTAVVLMVLDNLLWWLLSIKHELSETQTRLQSDCNMYKTFWQNNLTKE